MKLTNPAPLLLLAAFAAATLTTAAPPLQAEPSEVETVKTWIGPVETQLGVPTVNSVEKLFDEMDFQQAAQAYLWSLPTVGFEYVVREQRDILGAKNGDVVIYRGYDGVSRFLTPNVTTPYIIGFLDLKASGPFVIQVPAGFIAGSAMDFWQRTLTDFGVTGVNGHHLLRS